MKTLLARRIAAFALDVLILFVMLAPAGYLVQRSIGYIPQTGPEVWRVLLLNFSLPVWVYFLYCDRSASGMTLGKRLSRIRVSAVDDSRVGLLRAGGRVAVKLLPWELTHLSVFAFSGNSTAFSVGQSGGLIVANLFVLLYLGIAVATGGRASVHDVVVLTRVRMATERRPPTTYRPPRTAHQAS